MFNSKSIWVTVENIITKKWANCNKCNFATKQRMFMMCYSRYDGVYLSPSTQVHPDIFVGSSTLVCVHPIHTFSIYFMFLLTTLMLQFMCFWIWLFGKNNFWALQIEVGDCQCDDEWMVTRKAFYILKLGIWNWSVWRTGDVLTPLNGQKYGLVCFLTILLSVGSSQPNMDQIYWAKCAKQGLRMCWIRPRAM